MAMQPFQPPMFTQRSREETQREFPLSRPIVVPVTTVTSSGNTTLHTVASGYSMRVRNFGVCNIAGATIAVTVHVVPSGGSATNGNKVYDALSMNANTSAQLDAVVGATLEPGDFIVATCNHATGANVWLDGIEFAGGVVDA